MNHPIEGLMRTAMESIKEMVDVNTVVGDAVQAPDGSLIVPVSRVACGFAVGGSEFDAEGRNSEQEDRTSLPFGGGSGAGVSVQPVGFLVVSNGTVRLLPVDGTAMVDRLIDLAPQMMDRVKEMMDKDPCESPNSEVDEENRDSTIVNPEKIC
ncbi:sporulation protein YtfJ [Heliorestis acidaminivorans]|uniref:Sporulation protein YtfJ n=1 Tax=Heliorestis acidaminivorans TaxID=553427 RepID=A0A6I0F0L5_9FIRM|nr:GerW family sporulation protein [Heliorestis acidaminivorans]KAB2952624.1 sporulation protein YtfJ [Heliorestis acidaminivorans]